MDSKSLGELLKVALRDNYLKWFLRILALALLVAFIWGWVDYKLDSKNGKYAKYLWWQRNIPKGYPDTVWIAKIVYRDTSVGKSPTKIFKDNATNVQSVNQSGGQTARDITNNK